MVEIQNNFLGKSNFIPVYSSQRSGKNLYKYLVHIIWKVLECLVTSDWRNDMEYSHVFENGNQQIER